MEAPQPNLQERPLACPECGGDLPKGAMQVICEDCLNRRYLRVMLERERELWTDRPPAVTELARARGRVQHVAMAIDPQLTHCGQRATEPRKKRQRVKPNEVPAGVCPPCLANYNRIHQFAADLRRDRGGPI